MANDKMVSEVSNALCYRDLTEIARNQMVSMAKFHHRLATVSAGGGELQPTTGWHQGALIIWEDIAAKVISGPNANEQIRADRKQLSELYRNTLNSLQRPTGEQNSN